MTDLTSCAQRTAAAVLLRGYAVLAYASFVLAVAWGISFLADLALKTLYLRGQMSMGEIASALGLASTTSA